MPRTACHFLIAVLSFMAAFRRLFVLNARISFESRRKFFKAVVDD